MRYEDEEGYLEYKWLSPHHLAQLLLTLPEDCKVVANRVGNLAVMNADYTYRGFIDFNLEGTIED